MEIIKGTSKNFEEKVLDNDKTVLVDFYAEWCEPCQMLSPIVKEVAQENNNIQIVKINIDEEEDLSVKYQVVSIPTLVVVKGGNEIKRSVGVISKEKILELLK